MFFLKKISKSTLFEKSLYLSFLFSFILFCTDSYLPLILDTSYQLGKILRIANGEMFTDPIIGNKTIYPEIFHALYAILYKILSVNTEFFSKLVQVINYTLFLLASFLLFSRFIKHKFILLIALGSLHLVLHGSAHRVLFIVTPSSLALPLALLSIHYLFEFQETMQKKHLALLAFFASLSINIWWFFFLPLGIILFCFSLDAKFRKNFWQIKNFSIAAFFVLIPCLYTIIHFVSIWDTVLNYKYNEHTRPRSGPEFKTGLWLWFKTTALHGNELFVNRVWKKFSAAGFQFTRNPLKFTRLLHFAILSLPLTIITYFMIWKKFKFLKKENLIFKTIILPAILILILSFYILYPGNITHLRRAQSISYIFFHICLFYVIENCYFQWINKYKFIISIICFSSLFFFSTKGFEKSLFHLSPENKQLVTFLKNKDFKNEPRIFTYEATVFKLMPHTILNTYTMYPSRGSAYFRQDPKVATQLINDYYKILYPQKNPWEKTLKENKTRYMILQKKYAGKKRRTKHLNSVTRFYAQKFKAVFKNKTWLVLDTKKPRNNKKR